MKRDRLAFTNLFVTIPNLAAQGFALGGEMHQLILARLKRLAKAEPLRAPENPFDAYARAEQHQDMARSAWRHFFTGRPDKAMLDIIQIWRKEIRARSRALEEAGVPTQPEMLPGPNLRRLTRSRL
jgi:hypothetical protein